MRRKSARSAGSEKLSACSSDDESGGRPPAYSRTYNPADLTKAMDYMARKPKATIRKVADKFGIPRSTIMNHSGKGRYQASAVHGRPVVFSIAEEESFVEVLITAANYGFSCDRSDLASMVKEYLDSQPDRMTRFFKNKIRNLPGHDWIRNFEKRWKRKLSRRKFECLSVKRSASLHPEIIDPFFEMYRSHLEGVPPDRIYNCDETGIKTDGVKKRRCYSGKGAKSCYSKQPSEGKVQYTVMFTISAGGDLLPPYLLYKASSDHLFDTWTVGRGICFAMLLGGVPIE